MTWDSVQMIGARRHSIDKMKLWGQGADIGEPVHAGVDVSEFSALSLPVVWRCIRIISETLAALPVEVIRKRGEIREVVDRQPGWINQPNPETTWFEFHERVCESLLMDGNAFILISGRDAVGFPSELWTLHPQQVEVRTTNSVAQSNQVPSEGPSPIFFLWQGSTVLSRFGPTNPTGDVLHIKLATAGGLRGLSPIGAARQAIGLGLVAEKFGSRFFGRGQQMSGVIQLPAEAPKASKEHIDLMRETWEAAHAGSDRSFRPAVLTGGATWQGITIPPEDAQFLETRKFQVEDIAARIYGVPAHLVGLEEKNTSWGTGIEAQTTGFLQFTLMPHIVRLESAFSQMLPRGQFLNLNTKAFIRADAKTEADVLQTELQNGVISFNDWRAKLDLAPRRGGDAYMVPLNMQIIPANGVVQPPAPSPNGNGNVPQEVNQ